MISKRVFWRLAATGLLAALAACTPAATTGSIKVTVSAPSSMSQAPSVTVTDSASATVQTITTLGDTTVPNLQPGNYTVTPQKVISEGSGYTAPSSSPTVEVGKESPVLVEYVAATGAASVTVSGIPTGATGAVKIKSGATQIGSTLAANTSSAVLLSELSAGTYTIEAPAITVGTTTYSSAQNGTTFTVAKGAKTPVNIVYGVGSGSMTLTVAGLPTGVDGAVTVTGPGSFNQVVKATTTLNNLTPGAYSVSAAAVTNTGNTYSRKASETNPTAVTVNAGTTAATATVTYELSAARMAVTISGLGAATGFAGTLTLTPTTGTPKTQSFTGDGVVNVDNVPLGAYTAVATTTAHTGTYVDSSALTSASTAVTSANGATATVTFSPFVSGRVFVAGNGAFSNSGRPTALQNDGAYSLTDASMASATPTFDSLTGTNLLAAPGLMRVAFDKAGNLYAMYQVTDTTQPRVVRVSAANLLAGNLASSATGNALIDTAGLGGGAVEPADMAFDATGNLWVATDSQNRLICVSKTTMDAGGTISTPTANYSSSVQIRTVGDAALRPIFNNIHALAFDTTGNLWFTSGDFRPDISTGTPAAPAVTYGRRSVLARITAPACSGGSQTLADTAIPVRLDISNEFRRYVDATPALVEVSPLGGTTPVAGGPMLKPVTMALSPDGNSLWIGDFGGGNGKSGTAFFDADTTTESIIQVPLNTANTTPNTAPTTADGYNLRSAILADRITIAAGTGTNLGMQQVFGLAFDKTGRLWVATNNNVEVPTTATTEPLTDRKGKLYGITLTARDGSLAQWYARPVTADKTLSAPTDGFGFVGLVFNLPNPTTPRNVR